MISTWRYLEYEPPVRAVIQQALRAPNSQQVQIRVLQTSAYTDVDSSCELHGLYKYRFPLADLSLGGRLKLKRSLERGAQNALESLAVVLTKDRASLQDTGPD